MKIPFSDEELVAVGSYPASGTVTLKDKFKTPISSVENYKRYYRHEEPCWIANSDYRIFTPSIIPDNVARGYVREQDPTGEKGGKDMFGTIWEYIPQAGGSMVRPGTEVLADANDWRSVIPFPDVDSWDWKGCAERNTQYLGNLDEPIWMVQMSGFFERLISFMGFEEAILALVDEDQTDAVKELFSALCEVYIKILDNMTRYMRVDGYMLHDDWGSQMAPFFSRKVLREMIAPYIKRMTDHCHAKGIIFELHSCGHIDSIADEICDMGVDMWAPQTMNDLDELYRKYGDKISFGYVGPDLPADASETEQIEAAKALVARFCEPNKYIYANSAGCYRAFRKALYQESRKMFCQMD